ncbi:hypothetical protein ACFC1R_32425 [Kitasatospora sp. NPDC056138]|uniref:hypothetical protein n=1 Tax=Kitasatospora sp. NPDC056138 TaxID=3345724 RepID=UPI0035D96B70
MTNSGGVPHCPHCGVAGEDGYCPYCGARVEFGPAGTTIHVEGKDHTEVAEVARQLAADAAARQSAADKAAGRLAEREAEIRQHVGDGPGHGTGLRTAGAGASRGGQSPRTPWASGSFYLACVTVVVGLLLVAGSVLPAWTLPVVIVGAVITVAAIGALQLRHDDRLSERGFLGLMGDTLRHLPKAAVPRRRPKP